MLLENKKVAIIGGGPGGLTLARLLQLQNVAVTVYERDLNKNARVQGSTLDLHETSGLAAIRKANLLAEFKSNFLPMADKTVITDDQATVVFSDHDTDHQEDFGDAHYRPEIDRGALRKILLESLQAETVVWDSHFLSMEPQNEGWLLNFKNGQTTYADIVIASDGANSKIRPYLTDTKALYSGITMLEGNITESTKTTPNIAGLIKGGKVMAFGNTKNILLGQKGNDNLGFYASFKTDEKWASTNGLDYSNIPQVTEWFTTEYPEWSTVWKELFENASSPFIPRPIYYMPLDQNWKTLPNLTMIGDAAHVMPPFAGEGANMAMLDALELSEYLTSDDFNTLEDAISSFETKMRQRAAEATQESLENGDKMHAPDALQTMLSFFS